LNIPTVERNPPTPNPQND
jgi:hypothetical protein